jgi:Leucine-rich repeat (LRR) protein
MYRVGIIEYKYFENLNEIPFEDRSRVYSVHCNGHQLQSVPDLDKVQEYPFENLQIMDLSDNHLESFDLQKMELPSLRHLFLEYNYISSMGEIKSPTLEYLNLSNNKISDTSVLLYCEKLSGLDLSHNHLTKIDNKISKNAHSLRYLNLSSNQIEKIDDSGIPRQIQHLDLSNNHLKFHDLDKIIRNVDNDIKHHVHIDFNENNDHMDDISLGFYSYGYKYKIDIENNEVIIENNGREVSICVDKKIEVIDLTDDNDNENDNDNE